MTIRNLDRLFKPSSIALVGASRRNRSAGQVLARNLFGSGFDGPIMPVNPQERSVEGVLCYHSIAELPVVPDLAVINAPPQQIPEMVGELGERGTKAAIIVSGGFTELGEQGRTLQQAMLDAARPHLMRLVGPDSLGVMVPKIGLNASSVHSAPLKGDIALVAQSGAVAASIVDWATPRRIGFSHVISLGGKADVDFGDLLDYLAQDPGVRAILLYVEAITAARKFMSAARAAARAKPVIVIRAGRSEEAAQAASSHSGALAGADDVYDAAFRRAGMLRVAELDELFDAVETLATGVQVAGDRLAILTNGGGIGIMATDALIARGGRLARLAPDTIDKLRKVVPATWNGANPVDIGDDADGKVYQEALRVLLEDKGLDAILTVNCPSAVADGMDAAQAVVNAAANRSTGGIRKAPVLTSWLGEQAAQPARALFAQHRIPDYHTPNHAVNAFMHLVRYKRNQELLMETPPSIPEQFDIDQDTVRAIIDEVMGQGRAWLSEYEAKEVLRAYGIPSVQTVFARTPAEAERAAKRLRGRVVLKIQSPDIIHKSDIGGVALNLNPDKVWTEAEAMLERVRATHPDATIEGFAVQEMAQRSGAHELIVGMVDDAVFGPVILFGEGGTGVEIVQDKALSLPPLNMNLAKEMMGRTRINRLLQGYRAHPAANLEAIALTLIKVSQLVTDFAEIAELDINPLLADADGVLALDARIRVAPPKVESTRRLAVRPYPKKLEHTVSIKDGREFLIRPIRPEDEPLIHDMVAHVHIEDMRLRFFAPMKRLSHQMAARLTQIDYDREMALVAARNDGTAEEPREAIYGTVRITADPDNERAEYAVLLRSAMKGQGLGFKLMREILTYAETRGIKEVFGEVLRENVGMLSLCRDLGFTQHDNPDDPGIVEVSYRF